MADTQWAEEAPPGKKKSIPIWVWFCSGGCLLGVIVLVGVAWLGVSFVQKGMDPEVQWPKVAKLLPFDERPPELNLMFGTQIGVQQYQFADSRGFVAVLQKFGGKQGDSAREGLFVTDPPVLQGNVGMLKLENVERGTVAVQGRELPVLRAFVELGGLLKKIVPDEEAEEGVGPTAYIDLTPEGESGFLWLQLSRQGGGDEPVTDEEIRTFLEPFHVGTDR